MKRASVAAVVVAVELGVSALALVLTRSHGSSVRTSLVYEVSPEIWRANVDDSHPARLTSGTNPQISPDGRLVAFVRAGRDLLVIPAGGGKATRLRRFAGLVSHGWAPDSKHLFVQSTDRSLYLLDLRGKTRAIASRGVFGFSFSPDGRSFAYSLESSDEKHINTYVGDLRDGSTRRITHDNQSAYPLWLKAGIAYSRHGSLRLIDLHGQGSRSLGSLPEGIPLVASASGKRLLVGALLSEFGVVTEATPVYAIDLPSGESRTIPANEGTPLGLSRDGRFIMTSTCGSGEGEHSVRMISFLFGGKSRTLVRGACSASWNR